MKSGEGFRITRKLLSARNVTLRSSALKATQNAAEEAKHAALIGGGEVETAEHEA